MVIILFLFLFLSSSAILYTTAQNIQLVQDLALQALRSTAFSLAVSAENALRANGRSEDGQIREIFSDRVVAYALIVRTDGMILFHTNQSLIGSRLPSADIERLSKAGLPSGRRMTLQTGTPAYEFDYPLHNTADATEVLRLVLHTAPADQIVDMAERSWWTVGSVLLLLWMTGILLWRMFVRYVRLQNELAGQKHMALIGQMTAVLAHEIRNALASIKGYAQLTDEKTPESDVRKPGLAAILTGSNRIERLVNKLLLFSKEEIYHTEPIAIVPFLREAALLALPSWAGRVEIDGDARLRVKADKEKLHRVIDNGIRNAIQAMGEMGVLTLSARKDGRWVVIRIEDTGTGIADEEMPRLFTPFFTTKSDGTGLGLSYAEKVVKGMGGRIEITNRNNGTGAVLTIRLLKAEGMANG